MTDERALVVFFLSLLVFYKTKLSPSYFMRCIPWQLKKIFQIDFFSTIEFSKITENVSLFRVEIKGTYNNYYYNYNIIFPWSM